MDKEVKSLDLAAVIERVICQAKKEGNAGQRPPADTHNASWLDLNVDNLDHVDMHVPDASLLMVSGFQVTKKRINLISAWRKPH